MGEKKRPASALSKSKAVEYIKTGYASVLRPVRLAGEGGLRARLGEAGRRIAEAGHPVDGERDGYCSLYASLLKQS